MAEDAPKLSVKEKLFDFMVSASNAMSKTNHVSTFSSTGKLTPEEVREKNLPQTLRPQSPLFLSFSPLKHSTPTLLLHFLTLTHLLSFFYPCFLYLLPCLGPLDPFSFAQFVAAGDLLVYKCGSWSWYVLQGSLPSSHPNYSAEF